MKAAGAYPETASQVSCKKGYVGYVIAGFIYHFARLLRFRSQSSFLESAQVLIKALVHWILDQNQNCLVVEKNPSEKYESVNWDDDSNPSHMEK